MRCGYVAQSPVSLLSPQPPVASEARRGLEEIDRARADGWRLDAACNAVADAALDKIDIAARDTASPPTVTQVHAVGAARTENPTRRLEALDLALHTLATGTVGRMSAPAGLALALREPFKAASSDLDLKAQTAFVETISGLPFSNAKNQAIAVSAARDAMQRNPGPQEQGLARIALDVTTQVRNASDNARILDEALGAALAHARTTSDGPRAALLETLMAATRVEMPESRFRVAMQRAAVEAVAERVDADPGVLAGIGLDMIGQAYYFDVMLAAGDTILTGLERLAAAEGDTQFTPSIVTETRKQMGEASSPQDKIKALRRGFGECRKLTGDAFRNALIDALRGGQPANGPKVERADDYIIIGGVRVPRSPQSAPASKETP